MDSSFAKPWNGITVALEVRCEDVFSCGCADKGSFRGQLRRSSVSRGHRSIVSQGQRTPNLPNIRQMTAQSDDRISMDWARHCGLQDFGRGETVRVWTILLARQTTAKGWGLTSAMSSSNVALQSANAGWIFVLTAMILAEIQQPNGRETPPRFQASVQRRLYNALADQAKGRRAGAKQRQ